jgi:Glyoxalase/Bleomycin resistance protein/Dioxygenase superfamily
MNQQLANLGLGAPVQLAYAVTDAEQAALRWSATFGSGPFLVRRNIAPTEVLYRGRASTFDHTSAYGQWGSVMIELVQAHSQSDNVIAERSSTGPGASPFLHHVACLVDDIDVTLDLARDAGITLAMTATSRTTRFAFLDTTEMCGHFIEVYPRTASIVDFYATVAAAATNWNGSDPVRFLS